MRIRFGTDGWIGVMADEFTYSSLKFVVQAAIRYLKAHELGSKGVVVGYDTRFQSDLFAREIVQVLAGADIKTYLMDSDTPTSVLVNTVLEKRAGAGFMITGAHHDAICNGLKIITETGCPATIDITSEIEENMSMSAPDEKIFTIDFDKAEDSGLVEYIDAKNIYFNKLKKLVDFESIKKAGLKIAYDPVYGTGRNYIDYLLSSAGVKVKILHNYRDPLFGGLNPCVSEDNLRQLKKTVLKDEADIGIATNGDGSCVGLIDSLGNYINSNEFLAILMVHLIKKRKFTGKIVRTVATTHLLDKIGEKYGFEVIEVPVGFKYISQHMLKDDIILGGEESGGLSIIGHIPEKDGILAGLLAAEICAIEGKPLTTVLNEIMDEVGELHSSRIDIDLRTDEKKRAVIEKLKNDPPAYISGLKIVDIYDIDGIKYILNDGSWVLVRPSASKPIIRIYLEGTGRDVLRRLERFADELLR